MFAPKWTDRQFIKFSTLVKDIDRFYFVKEYLEMKSRGKRKRSTFLPQLMFLIVKNDTFSISPQQQIFSIGLTISKMNSWLIGERKDSRWMPYQLLFNCCPNWLLINERISTDISLSVLTWNLCSWRVSFRMRLCEELRRHLSEITHVWFVCFFLHQ